jgi:tRNA threonylcarbamoyladenosine biosynthesis protein TsaB
VSRILAVDTTGDCGSIALVTDGVVVEEARLESTDGFAHVLFPAIAALVARHSLTIRDLDLFASASGPGSFTGVRVGLAAVKGLAEATGRQVVAVSNLQALAWYGTRLLRGVVIDARRGEIYGAVYDDRLRPVSGEVVMKLDEWLASLPAGDLEFITSGCDAAFPGLVTRAPAMLAGAIGVVAALAGIAQDPATIDANYVRRSDAELYWKE